MKHKDIEQHLSEVILTEFNWRWKKYLKNEQSQKQFSMDFRKFLRRFAKAKRKVRGCRKYFEKEDRRCGVKYGYYKGEKKRAYVKKKTDYDIWLCKDCAKAELNEVENDV